MIPTVYYLQSERIEGVYKKGRRWRIPADAKKPADSRVKTGAYKKSKMPSDLPLPVGISDYRLATSEYYYVDKTMMIKDFLDERPMVSLFTRPRRFGKTLNMDMLRTFFEKTDEDTSVYFRDKISGGLKDNRHLSYGFLTGILHVAKESIFSGLNNLKVNSILDRRYSEYFGFTQEEVRAITRYYIRSNGESGEGRYDIQLFPRSEDMPGNLIELKAAKNVSGDKLKRLSETDLAQIEDRKYDTDMAAKSVQTIFKYGVAFSGKQVEITTDTL